MVGRDPLPERQKAEEPGRSWPTVRVVLLLSLVLAGCTTPVASEAPGPEAPGAPELVWSLGDPSVVAPVPNNQVEAALTVSPDGQTVLTCFHGLFTETSPGYASTDGGESWTRMAFPPEAGVGGDCETALLEDGSWAFLASTVAGATVMVSQDNGTTWIVSQAAAIPINGLADRPWLAGVGNELWLTYMPLYVQPGTIGFTKSTDHGQTWSTPILIGTPGPDSVSVRHGHMVVGDGTVYIPMVRYSIMGTGLRVVQLASSRDGVSWEIDEVIRTNEILGDWPSLALTEAGELVMAVTLAGRSIGYMVRHADGAWDELGVLHDAGDAGASWPWIDGGNGHNATFIVEGRAADGERQLWIGRIDALTGAIKEWPVWPGPGVEFASVDHDREGRAYAAWVAGGDAQYFVRSNWDAPLA